LTGTSRRGRYAAGCVAAFAVIADISLVWRGD
jgi:hypothetical protein